MEGSGYSLSKYDLHNIGTEKCVITQTKEISEDLRKTVVDAHQAEKVIKPFPQILDSTTPLSGRSYVKGGNSTPLLSSPEVVDQTSQLQWVWHSSLQCWQEMLHRTYT